MDNKLIIIDKEKFKNKDKIVAVRVEKVEDGMVFLDFLKSEFDMDTELDSNIKKIVPKLESTFYKIYFIWNPHTPYKYEKLKYTIYNLDDPDNKGSTGFDYMPDIEYNFIDIIKKNR